MTSGQRTTARLRALGVEGSVGVGVVTGTRTGTHTGTEGLRGDSLPGGRSPAHPGAGGPLRCRGEHAGQLGLQLVEPSIERRAVLLALSC